MLVHGSEVIVTETVRFEGISNPEDQAILDAVVTPCGRRGLFSAAYGVYASAGRRGGTPGTARSLFTSRRYVQSGCLRFCVSS